MYKTINISAYFFIVIISVIIVFSLICIELQIELLFFVMITVLLNFQYFFSCKFYVFFSCKFYVFFSVIFAISSIESTWGYPILSTTTTISHSCFPAAPSCFSAAVSSLQVFTESPACQSRWRSKIQVSYICFKESIFFLHNFSLKY